jgi:phosphate starvation-inducible PhoH-like protein
LDRKFDRIILSRPAVEAGEKLGFLPGDLKEKIDPYLRPLYDALYDMIQPEIVNRLIENSEIEIAPLAYMRGRTLNNAIIILDEAQNTSMAQMKMFLTRMGNGSRIVVTGDPTQVDLPKDTISGLADAVKKLHEIKEIGFINFTESDIVRHPLTAKIIEAYEKKKVKKDDQV